MLKNVYSVGQVNRYIATMFLQDFFLKKVSVKGEVSNCKYHSSGHIYFTLKDENAILNAVMFAGNRQGLDFYMKEGDKVVVTGSIEFFERDGKCQFYAKEIALDGIGNLYLQFEARKKELEEMGMFALEYKRPIPKFAKRIGIVTAPTGAAIQDIRTIAFRRNPYVQLILYPALVQGEGAKESIVNGIHALEDVGVDVIIVGRGGGSLEDLWAFNEEVVARAIFHCKIPIISAVGHEIDWTIADYASDLRAPTPSAAAELAVFDYRFVVQDLIRKKRELHRHMNRKIDWARQQILYQNTKLDYLNPKNRLTENRKHLIRYQQEIIQKMKWQMQLKRQKLSLLARTLEGYSPAKKMSHGYAYVEREQGGSLQSVEMTKENDVVLIHLSDGVLKAVVMETKKHD